MSFWDRVSDLADAFPVVGNAFNTIVDTARALDDDDKSTLDAVKGAVGTNYGQPIQHAGQVAAPAGELLGKAYSFGVARPLSTIEQMTGVGLVGAGPTALLNAFEDHPGLKAAWQQSKDLSPGQASMVNINRAANIAGPTDFKTAGQSGARGDNYDPWFSFMSGTQDAVLSWYADPLVVAGKAAQATKAARTVLKPGDLAAITTDGAKLTSRQTRLQSKWNGLMDVTRDKNAAELYQLAFIRESSAGDSLASLIAKANKETDQTVRDGKVRDILRVGFGDRAFIQELRQHGDSLADDIENLNEPLDWMKAAPDSPEMADRIARAEEEISRRSSYLDELDRLKKVEYKLGTTLGPSASGDMLDSVRLGRLRQDSILTDGVGSRPVYAMRWLSGYRPAGWVNLHDGQNVSKNAERMLERVKGLDAETRMHWMGRILNADTDAARQVELLRLERDVFHHVATQVGGGISDDAIKKLYEQYGKRRHAVLSKWQNRTYSGGEFDGHRADLHFDDDSGMFVARPITDTHLDNEMPLLDVDHIYQVLKRERHTARHLSFLDDAGELTTEVLDRYSQVWKLGALMRLGYMIRTTMDPQLRMLAVLGGMGYLATAGEGATNLLKNRLGRVSVHDADDLAQRVRAQARLDEIEARLAGSVEYSVKDSDHLAGVGVKAKPELLDREVVPPGTSLAPAGLGSRPAGFHGTAVRFDGDQLRSVEELEGHSNLYGPGFYTTASRDVATEYTEKLNRSQVRDRQGAEREILYEHNQRGKPFKGTPAEMDRMIDERLGGRVVYGVKWTGEGEPRFLDLDKAAPAELRNSPTLREWADGTDYSEGFPELRRLLDDPNSRGRDIYSAFKAAMVENGTTTSDADEAMHWLRQDLMDAGYDGFAHRGGHALGKGHDHKVRIYFDTTKLKVTQHQRAPFVAGRAETPHTPHPGTVDIAGDFHVPHQQSFVADMQGTVQDLSALRAEAERLRARLAEPARKKTVRRGQTDEKQRLGVGTLDAGGYKIEDAHGVTAEDFARSFGTIDAKESVRTLMDDTQASMRKTLRMTGNFDLIDGNHTGYEGAWLKAVNHQIRQSKLSEHIIAGEDDATLKRWMRRTTEGRDYVRRMRAIYHGDLDEMIGRHRATIDSALGGSDELYLLARERDLTIADLAKVEPDRTHWPKINGGVIEQTYNSGMLGPMLERLNEQFYKFMSDVPETVLGRHPLYVQLYRQRAREMVRNADPRGEGVLTADDIGDITRAARDYARNEMKRTLFHIDSKSNLAHKLRFIFPFFSAWEDTMVKYGRIVMERPQVLPHSAMLWQAPEQAGLTVDLDGNVVQSGGLNDQHFVLVPSIPGLKKITSAAQWRLSKSSVNIILQGDPWWIPGWGGLTGYAANEIAKRKPSLGDEFDKAGLLPFGVQTSSWDFLSPEPRWSRYLRKATNPDDQDYKETFAYIYATEAMKVNTGEREKPKSEEAFLDEVAKRTRNWYFARAFASGVLPVSASPQGDKQFYFDEAHRFREKYGLEWEKRFYQEYPEYFEAAVSLSKSNTGVDATMGAYNASKKYKDLIARRPEYGWFVVGEEGEGDYNQAVRTAQFSQRVAPGSSTRFRDTKDPRAAVTEVQVDKGWMDYSTMVSRLDAELQKRGLHSYQQTGAEDLAAFKKAFVADLGKRNPEWQRDFEDFGGAKTGDFLRYAADVVKDKRLQGRGDIQAMRTYLAMRTQVQGLLASRESHTLGAQSNADVATFWAAFGQWLKGRYVTFGDTYDRMLENDDLSVRV